MIVQLWNETRKMHFNSLWVIPHVLLNVILFVSALTIMVPGAGNSYSMVCGNSEKEHFPFKPLINGAMKSSALMFINTSRLQIVCRGLRT